MTGTKGHSGGPGRGGGRKPRQNAERHNVMIDSQVWDWLQKSGNASQQIEKLARDEMNQSIKETMQIVRKFAETVADAYVNQYVDPDGRKVMNQVVVYYNRVEKKFGWCSSLTPLSEDEVAVEWPQEDGYGEMGDDLELARAALIEFVISECDEPELMRKIDPEE